MSDQTCHSKCRCEWACAHLILRLWVGLRLLFAGLDKMREKGGSGFGLDFIPKSMAPIKENMIQYSILPKWSVEMYAQFLPFALLIIGAWAIIGLFTRASLFAAGLLFVSLSLGLMSLPDDDQAVMRGIEVAITAFALVTSSSNLFSLDGLLFRKKSAE